MKMRLAILSVGLFIMLEGILYFTLESRGGRSIDLRFFHELGLALTVSVSCFSFFLITRRLNSRPFNIPLFQSAFYLFILFGVWTLMLPLGDQATILWQKLQGTRDQTSIGWFYLNDSAYGNRAMKLTDMLIYIWFIPWLPFLIVLFTYLVFKCKISTEQDR